MTVFKILIVFYSLDVLRCIITYLRTTNFEDVEKKTLYVFAVFAASFGVSIFWNIGKEFRNITRFLE